LTPPDASHDRELAVLEHVLRSDAPQPDPAFAREMDARVAARFKRERRFAPRLWVPAAAVAGAAAVTLLVLAAIGVLGGGHNSTSGLQAHAGRRIEHTASLTLSVPPNEIGAAATGGVSSTAVHEGGYVLRSSTARRIVVRVPAGRLETTLSELAGLGEVRTRAESSHDMTAPYNAVQGRLGNAATQRDTLVVKLRSAHGTAAAMLRTRLRAISRQVTALGAEAHDLRVRTSYSTVVVTLEARQP
jgi:hypothetical protein